MQNTFLVYSFIICNAVLITQPLLCVWSMLTKWPTFAKLLDSMGEVQVSAEEHRQMSLNKSSAVPSWFSVEITVNAALHIIVCCYMVYASVILSDQDENMQHRTKVTRDTITVTFGLVISGTVDCMFLALCSVLRRGLERLCNDDLSALQLCPELTEEQIIHLLEKTRIRHAQLTKTLHLLTEAFAAWMLLVCTYVFVYLMMGVYVAIVFIPMSLQSSSAALDVQAGTFLFCSALAMARLMLLCGSASKTAHEVRFSFL
jgi:hypothetical protein